MILMALGPFRFSVEDMVLKRFGRRLSARHADVDLVGRAPASQFLGPGKETISLPAVIYPYYLGGAGLAQLDGMRAAADAGTPLMLAAGTGRVLGNFTLREVDDEREHFLPNGSPLKVEIRVDLARYVPVGGFGTGLFGLFR